ncbi:MAG: hypothetical protein FWC43_04075, partial [Planctomycetaceae bacterium]|nr:hypothetical protein [Planctomycetaceae bacterium]
MDVILFGATIPTDKIAVAALALITAALLFNVKKYFARRSPAGKRCIKPGEEPKYMTSREMAQKNAKIKPEPTFTGAYKPEKISQWEVEFFELTRQMTAQIDTKMSALSVLSIDAAKICERMETLLERLERATQATVGPPVRPVPPSSTSFGESVRRSGNFRDFPPVTPPSSTVSPLSSESSQEKKTLFPRLSSLSGLEFSDNDDLLSLGKDLFPETANPMNSSTKYSLREPQNDSTDRTLGELLLQEKQQNQTAKPQSASKIASMFQPTPIESIFKPMES